jgi:hypothetical protein
MSNGWLDFLAHFIGEPLLGLAAIVLAMTLLPVITFGRVRVDMEGTGDNSVARAPDGTILLHPELASLVVLILGVALAFGVIMLFHHGHAAPIPDCPRAGAVTRLQALESRIC